MFEEFTSSTCLPCAFFNSDFVPWCNARENDITLIKYQMNFPGAGDPYYTEECGERGAFYGVIWVPWLVCDGKFVETEMNDVNALYESDSTEVSLIQIQAAHTLSGHTITVNTTVLPFANFPACRLFMAVIEKATHNNTGNNGETTFEHVMMKMIPSSMGIAVNFQERTLFNCSYTVDLSGTNVEEWDDLMVVAWVQNSLTKKVFQSVYSIADADFGTENRLGDIVIENSSLNGFTPDVFEYNYGVPAGITVAPDVIGIPMDSAAIVIVIPALSIPGTTTLDVYAEDIQYHTQYKVNFLPNTDLVEYQNTSLSVYPNPASDYIFIHGADNCRVSITDAIGRQYRVVSDFTANRISTSDLPKGIYYISVEKPGHTSIVKKIIITRDK
jgi:hypothetical protein